MKNLNIYIKEDFFGNVGSTPEDNKRRKTIPFIEAWLKKHKVKKYTINEDLTIDVDRDVWIGFYTEKEFPDYIQFNKVGGFFCCNGCPNLTSLRGTPKEVGVYFSCENCPKLTSLEGCPKEVGGDFDCCNCPELNSLSGAPEEVGRSFYCSYCPKLISLEGAPKEIKRNFYCIGCPKLTSLEGAPEKVGGDFYCSICPNLKDDPNVVLKNIVKGKIFT